VIHKPEQMEYPDKKEDHAGDDQVQLVAHLIPPICGRMLQLVGGPPGLSAAAACRPLWFISDPDA
jgi:hypothetical protein